ncbi:hypothetical protein FDN13_05900 [Caloramator sp. E03]|uniref:hypothetical protein n=1 Tax=Caloramator sp. E03 TaxID=2576307 RepID=UPI001110102C|nr:hypothetical protein [Caloramator sp. E03]QCX33272.1 hypothetical protein FDN13_05900 [Caloramator sp. E03]
MVDRNNIDDVFKVINDDFDWMIEDMTQYNNIVKEKIHQYINQDCFDDADDYKEKYKDMKKLIEKVMNLKSEFISLCIDDEKNNNKITEDNYDDLMDWTDTNPEEVLLFGDKYKINSWREVLLLVVEEIGKKNKQFINNIDEKEEFKGRTRIYFSYDESQIEKRFYKKLPNGLYVMVNASANSIVSLCRKLLRTAGFTDKDLKIKVNQENKNSMIEEIKVDNESGLGIIKLPKKYGSISIDKEIFKNIVYSILKRKEEYGTEYIEPRKIESKFDNVIISRTNYTTSYHVIINIINYLKDFHLLDNYNGTKKGKYKVVDDESLKMWIDNNILR